MPKTAHVAITALVLLVAGAGAVSTGAHQPPAAHVHAAQRGHAVTPDLPPGDMTWG